MTNSRIPEAKLRKLRELAATYYGARHAIEIEYLDPWINPETYTTDGVLDYIAYLNALAALEDYVDTTEMRFVYSRPTPVEPYGVACEQLFGYFEFEARVRQRKVRATMEAALDTAKETDHE